jgi:hypothetical protein
MADADAQRTAQAEPVTVDTALANAARILHNAEMETNHVTMERLEKLADSWISIAAQLIHRDRA